MQVGVTPGSMARLSARHPEAPRAVGPAMWAATVVLEVMLRAGSLRVARSFPAAAARRFRSHPGPAAAVVARPVLTAMARLGASIMDWLMVPAAVAGMAADRLALLPAAPAAGPAATATTGRGRCRRYRIGCRQRNCRGRRRWRRWQISDLRLRWKWSWRKRIRCQPRVRRWRRWWRRQQWHRRGERWHGRQLRGRWWRRRVSAEWYGLGRGRRWRERCHCRHLYARDQLHDIGGVSECTRASNGRRHRWF